MLGSARQVLVIFGTGGMCWDAYSCGDPMFRSMAVDALQAPHPAIPRHCWPCSKILTVDVNDDGVSAGV